VNVKFYLGLPVMWINPNCVNCCRKFNDNKIHLKVHLKVRTTDSLLTRRRRITAPTSRLSPLYHISAAGRT